METITIPKPKYEVNQEVNYYNEWGFGFIQKLLTPEINPKTNKLSPRYLVEWIAEGEEPWTEIEFESDLKLIE